MNEDLAAVVTGEKAIPLVGVVPLDLAGRHAQTSRRREQRTTSDHATDRMLWAFLRLSVRGAGSQPRYRRFYVFCRFPRGDQGPPGTCRRPGGEPRAVWVKRGCCAET